VPVTYGQVRDMALVLPGAEEVLTWGTDTTFRVRGRMFAVTAPESSYATLKASPEDQAELIADDPQTFAVAPYTGRFGWVRVELSRIEPDHMRELIVEAWRRTATHRQVADYDKD
jgi:hypothetical protein